jgi:hypothetical protein
MGFPVALAAVGKFVVDGVKALAGAGVIKNKNDEAAAETALRTHAMAFAIEQEETYRAELEAQKEIIVAEMHQGDNFTKRARPSIIYTGLGVIIYNSVLPSLVSLFSQVLGTAAIVIVPINPPAEFWVAWGGVVSIYAWGRSREKMNGVDKVSAMITGSRVDG